jgi:pyridoxine 5'-phosphate synthase PdxJ
MISDAIVVELKRGILAPVESKQELPYGSGDGYLFMPILGVGDTDCIALDHVELNRLTLHLHLNISHNRVERANRLMELKDEIGDSAWLAHRPGLRLAAGHGLAFAPAF